MRLVAADLVSLTFDGPVTVGAADYEAGIYDLSIGTNPMVATVVASAIVPVISWVSGYSPGDVVVMVPAQMVAIVPVTGEFIASLVAGG